MVVVVVVVVVVHECMIEMILMHGGGGGGGGGGAHLLMSDSLSQKWLIEGRQNYSRDEYDQFSHFWAFYNILKFSSQNGS